MKKTIYFLVIFALILPNIAMAKGYKDAEAQGFINEVVAKVEPVLKDYNLAYWNATTTGKKEWYKRYEEKDLEYRKLMSDKGWFETSKSLRKAKMKDPLVARQVELIYLDILENQIDPKLNEELVKKGAALEESFYKFRAVVDGVEIPDNKIRDVLRKSKDVGERQRYWEASKQVGEKVHKSLIELVELRNRAAKELGFKDYYELKFYLQEQGVGEVFDVLNELAKLTGKPFKDLKSEIDPVLAKRYGVKEAELMPWHYEDVFFQEVPQVYSVNLDKYFSKIDVVKLAKDYYARMGMDVDDVLKRSDLFERKDKYQHAYCTDIDRKGDIRVLENVRSTEEWAQTSLHELGHSLYMKYYDMTGLPYYLKDAAQTFTTEGVAEMFGGLVNNPAWLENAAFPAKKAEIEGFAGDIVKLKKADLLIFARWVLVMANFERELYSNPRQNLNKLWWNLVERYQMVQRPKGRDNADWAAKIHFTTAPVYYHNYQLGRLFGAQMENYIAKNIAPVAEAFLGNPKVGEYLIEKVFRPGMKWKWDRFVKESTGEKLTAKYFAKEIE